MPLVLITGGTGVLGSELAPRFASAGYDVRVMSRRAAPADAKYGWAQADIMTGEGISAVVEGVDLIVHCASSPVRTKGTDVEGTRRLLDAASAVASGKPRVFYISIVGIDRIPLGYYKGKAAAEQVIEQAALPWTILRAVQFHPLIDQFLRNLVRLPVAVLPKKFKFQPIDPAEVAERMVQYAVDDASGRLPDLGGPEVRTFEELARAWLTARGKRAVLVNMPLFGKIASGFRNGYNCTSEHADGTVTWEEWLAKKYGDS